jgi:hypothetical protein
MLLISECRVYVGRGMFILFARRIRSISSGRVEWWGDGSLRSQEDKGFDTAYW